LENEFIIERKQGLARVLISVELEASDPEGVLELSLLLLDNLEESLVLNLLLLPLLIVHAVHGVSHLTFSA
jgi:hypothetical protein